MITVDAAIALPIATLMMFIGNIGPCVAALYCCLTIVTTCEMKWSRWVNVNIAIVTTVAIGIAGAFAALTIARSGVTADPIREVTRDVEVTDVDNSIGSTNKAVRSMGIVHTADAHGNVSQELITDNMHIITDVADGDREYLQDVTETTVRHYDAMLLPFLRVTGDTSTEEQFTELHLSKETLHSE